MHTYKSGAFIQQCFASHPLSLSFKTFASELVVLQCTSCRFRHQIRIENLASRAAGSLEPQSSAQSDLARCAGEHAAALRISEMDVTVDAVELRCRECRKTFAIRAAEFETHAP